jgi:GntR family transcriptional regulator
MGRLARPYRRSNMPLYLQVAATLRRRIETGHWPAGARISTIEMLMGEFGVARVTIRQALALLQREGMVRRQQGRGTFVTDNIPDKRWLRLEIGLSTLLDSIVDNVPEFLAVRSPPPWPTLHPGDGILDTRYVYLKSVQRRDTQPFGVVSVHLAKRVFDLAPARFAASAALPILSELDGVTIGRAHQTMVIGTADTEIAELLDIELNAPTAEANCTVIDDGGIAIYVAQIVYRGDCIKFDIELTSKPF